MTTVTFTRRLGGEVPKFPPKRLPEGAAQYASDCVFSHGELRALKAPFLLRELDWLAKSLYTQDGINFFTWYSQVEAIRSPIAQDEYERVYYTTETDFRVTQWWHAKPGGGEPSQSWRAGVPRPSYAPTITVEKMTDAPAWLDSIAIYFHYEHHGKQYQRQSVTSPAKVEYARIYETPFIALDDGGDTEEEPTPEEAIPVLSIVGVGPEGDEVFHVYTAPSQLTAVSNLEYLDGGATAILKARIGGTWRKIESWSEDVALADRFRIEVEYGDSETRAYTYTYVNQWGEESAPSEATVISFDPFETVTWEAMWDGTEQGAYYPIDRMRLYRSAQGSSGYGMYRYVVDVSTIGGGENWVDTVETADLGEELKTQEWEVPDMGLVGLRLLPNGSAAAFKDNELWISEPELPYAWKHANILTFDHDVVAIEVLGSSLVVTTTGYPYLVTGATPDGMFAQRLSARQAGISRRSICSLGDMVVYASNDGLVAVAGNQASLDPSHHLFTREDWRARYGNDLDDLLLAHHDGKIVGLFPDRDGFILRLDEAAGEYTRCTVRADGAQVLPQTDGLYITDGNDLSQFAGGTDKTFAWWSREVTMPKPINFGVLQVDCDGPLTVQVYADGEQKLSKGFSDGGGTARLPSGFRARHWSVRVVGAGAVERIQIATTGAELERV